MTQSPDIAMAPAVVLAPASSLLRRLGCVGFDLLVLTKYRITLVALFTGYAAIAVEGHHATEWPLVVPCLLALFLTGGCANTLNQLFELKRDALMNRTRSRRPLPAGRISRSQALCFAIVQIILAQWLLLWGCQSVLAAALSMLTVVYYSFFYTLYLKPRHYLNIVIGGVPGAMGPLIGWAAVAHHLSAAPIAMFMLIFLWTPPHVWALAIKLKDDYARAGIPMLPVVKGVDETTRQIVIYSLVMVIATLALPAVVGIFGPAFQHSPLYLTLALTLGTVFMIWVCVLWRRRPMLPTMPLFRFSIVYIAALFLGLMIDAFRSHAGRL